MNRIYLTIGTLATFLLGILFFLIYNNWLIISVTAPGFVKDQSVQVSTAQKKAMPIAYWQNHRLKTEKKDLFWTDNLTANYQTLVESWLNILDEEGVLDKPCTVQAVSLTQHNQELFISFDRSPLNDEDSTYNNLMLIHSLLKTLQVANQNTHASYAKAVRLLVDHQPLIDSHLDFSRSWPIQGFVPQSVECKKFSTRLERKQNGEPLTIMLDPAGDAQRTGRIIDDTFERGITLQCAEKIKLILETEFSSIFGGNRVRIILTRVPGETLDSLQNASFANRLDVDLYIHIGFYQAAETELPINMYYVTYQPVSDFWFNPNSSLSLIHYNQAHLYSIKKSCSLSYQLAADIKAQAHTAGFAVKDPIGLPFRPLLGIIPPALAIEAGLKTKDDLQKIINPLVQALKVIIKNAAS